MSSEEETVVMFLYHRRRKRRHRYWVHPYITNNVNKGVFICARELAHHEIKFKSMYRMSKSSFSLLADLVRPLIAKSDTNYRRCVTVEERLLITLRYLGTGASMSSLAFYFVRGHKTISSIIATTVKAIWIALQAVYMPKPNQNMWTNIADKFQSLWDLPNCLGSLDGKHIRIQKLPHAGSLDFNYKHYHSIVLLACSDADGNFISIETGFHGRMSDGGIFRQSRIGTWLERDGLEIPDTRVLLDDKNNTEFPFYFIGDEAFPLKTRLMTPYKQRELNNKKRVFNYRLSRARRVVECAFGMMSQKFQILKSCIVSPNRTNIENIIKACCILHNFIRKREGRAYVSEENGEESNDTRPPYMNARNYHLENLRPASYRDYLANYFISTEGALSWQWKYCVNEDEQ